MVSCSRLERGSAEAFNEACNLELPEQLSTPPGDDYAWQVRLVEEMNRRHRIGEVMDFSTLERGIHDTEDLLVARGLNLLTC